MEFQYDESISSEVDWQRKYELDKLDISSHGLGNIAVIADAAMQNLKKEHPGWTGSEDYSDLFDSIGVLFRYYGNRMLDDSYAESPSYRPEDYAWKDEEDLHLSLSTVEQFGFIKFLKRGE